MSVVLAALALPTSAAADHVSIAPGVSARIVNLSEDVATVEVTWSIACRGVGSEGVIYFGSLRLIDTETLEEIYMGGVSTATGASTQSVSRRNVDRLLRPRLDASCADYATLHGSDNAQAFGGVVVIPAKGAGGGGGGGGSGGGGGGGNGGAGDPDAPLGGEGCAAELLGTGAADELEGTAAGDLILGFGGGDRIRGRDANDCLIGGKGRDRMRGDAGRDRLTGDSGADRLDGGPGKNAYDAGGGDDRISARNGVRDVIRCGPGHDHAWIDTEDRLRACESISIQAQPVRGRRP
jgi:hypothetical protein